MFGGETSSLPSLWHFPLVVISWRGKRKFYDTDPWFLFSALCPIIEVKRPDIKLLSSGDNFDQVSLKSILQTDRLIGLTRERDVEMVLADFWNITLGHAYSPLA